MIGENEMLYCLIAFILGWLVARQMGNGFTTGGMSIGARGGLNTNCPDGLQCDGEIGSYCGIDILDEYGISIDGIGCKDELLCSAPGMMPLTPRRTDYQCCQVTIDEGGGSKPPEVISTNCGNPI